MRSASGFTADDPDTAMRIADRLVSLFIVQTSSDRTTLAEGTDQFLEAQLENARRDLIENETKLAEYRRRHHGELPTQLEANVRGLNNTEMQMQVLADSLNRDRERQLLLERSLKDTSLSELLDAPRACGSAQTRRSLDRGRTAATRRGSPRGHAIDLDRAAPRHRRHEADDCRAAQTRRRPRAPVTTTSADSSAADTLRRSRLEDLRAELSAVERQIAEKAAEAERLRGVLLNYQRRIDGAPTREAELAALTRDYDTLQQTYRGLLAKKQESEIAANLERQQIGAQFKVLDPARLPEQPFAPKRVRLYAIASSADSRIGLLVAMILERFDRGLRTRDEVLVALGLPVLAAIPVVSARPRSVRRGSHCRVGRHGHRRQHCGSSRGDS